MSEKRVGHRSTSEVKNSKTSEVGRRENVLGVPVDLVSGEQTLEIIEGWVLQATTSEVKNSKTSEVDRPRHIVTAYSEFFVHAQRDSEFKKILQNADLVLPDGVGPLAAIDFQQRLGRPHPNHLLKGEGSPSPLRRRIQDEVKSVSAALQTAFSTITGRVGTPVTGVWLTQQILQLAPEKHWKVFLLGGFGDTAERLAERSGLAPPAGGERKARPSDWIKANQGIQDFKSATPADHQKIISEINQFQSDILLVAYGPVKQEKWIAKYKSQLKASIIIGVGGSFDELTGRAAASPQWMQRRGLKWLWRLITQPKRLKRIWNAVVIFPYLMWRSPKKP